MDEVADNRLSQDMFVWLEIVSRHGDVLSRHRLGGEDFHVGRGYGNDVILDDPYVAPRHLRVFCDADGAWIAEDLGSANGLFAGRDKQRQSQIALDDDRIVRIGQTHLRLRRPSHAVAAERVPRHAGQVLFIALALGAVTVGLSALGLWLGETAEPKFGRYLVPLLVLPLVVLAWAGIWALMSRIFSRQARFELHLLIATIAVLASWLIGEGGAVLAFAGSWPSIGTYDFVADWLVGATAIFSHLYVIGPSRLWLKGALVTALMLVGIAIQSVDLFDARDQSNLHSARLYPPSVRLVPLRSEAAFFADLDRLKGQLERDRQRPVADGPGLSFDVDEYVE